MRAMIAQAIIASFLISTVILALLLSRLGAALPLDADHEERALYIVDGTIDIGSTTTLEGEPYAPLGKVSQFFYRAANRGDQFRGDFQSIYDEGIQVALKYLGE